MKLGEVYEIEYRRPVNSLMLDTAVQFIAMDEKEFFQRQFYRRIFENLSSVLRTNRSGRHARNFEVYRKKTVRDDGIYEALSNHGHMSGNDLYKLTGYLFELNLYNPEERGKRCAIRLGKHNEIEFLNFKYVGPYIDALENDE